MRSVIEDPALIYVVAICNLSRAYIPRNVTLQFSRLSLRRCELTLERRNLRLQRRHLCSQYRDLRSQRVHERCEAIPGTRSGTCRVENTARRTTNFIHVIKIGAIDVLSAVTSNDRAWILRRDLGVVGP